MLSIIERTSTALGPHRFAPFVCGKDRDVNESDTVTIVTDILSEVFGFDKYTEITTEQAIRGTYCDLAVRTPASAFRARR